MHIFPLHCILFEKRYLRTKQDKSNDLAYPSIALHYFATAAVTREGQIFIPHTTPDREEKVRLRRK